MVKMVLNGKTIILMLQNYNIIGVLSSIFGKSCRELLKMVAPSASIALKTKLNADANS